MRLTPNTLWLADEVGTNDSAKKHTIRLFEGKEVFETRQARSARPAGDRGLYQSGRPRPRLISLDPALRRRLRTRWGGGGLVSRWDRSTRVTHCCAAPDRKVIEGEQGRHLADCVGWKGGGGFRFYRLGPPVFDEEGRIRHGHPLSPSLPPTCGSARPADRGTGAAGRQMLGLHDGHAYALAL